MLHIIKSLDKLPLAIDYAGEKDDFLLVEEAVYAGVAAHTLAEQLAQRENLIFLLKEDVQARGLEGLVSPSYSLISFVGFVELTAENEKSMTW
ncbi:sulfurtransferase complex subunit TusB [Vibrio sp. S4M6]|uniref:sulfurtransferase complex subunit TusB n=1 Tax=Vibrio sinus TaxID=2946865 RepID=UPI002029C4CA|nr:sulfurtransferase complex subunit TusB [Vibrio sinus]